MQRTKKRPGAANSGASISSYDGACESANHPSEACEDAQAHPGEMRPVVGADGKAVATDLASVAPSYSTLVAEAVEEGFEFFGERLAAATPAQVSDAILVKIV